ncbi:TraB/GumN family protein [Sphingomonas sp. LB-2]|uniref:TraB/GumN family protein n=1 Tax=Sphingomonas caeni TaxID=2984949 RepID=UPI0022319E78|nr:TraB/GumN family protein [Sphingomonas caeni]MCW3847886.1 TraB/GumN family protein [Sphingomonas caeni]
MLKMFARALTALALLLTPAAHAQTVKDADPAIWVVRDRDTTIYLFGTFHALKPGLTWFDEAVKDAFDKSDEVMLEMVLPDAATVQDAVRRIAYHPGGPTITELLPQDKRAPYAAAMTGLGVPPAIFENFDPWLPAATLSSVSLPKYGFDPNLGAEHVITDAATAAGKPVGGFETVDQQLGFFHELPQPIQVKFLVQTIDELPKLGATLDSMLDKWSAGDAEGIGKLLNEDLDQTPEMASVLLFQRNERWAGWIAERMERPGTVFIAVGAGHLTGRNSVQDYLAKRHLTAERIPY